MRRWITSISLIALVVALATDTKAADTVGGSFSFALATLPPVSVSGKGPGSGAGGAGGTITLGATPFGTAAARIPEASTLLPPLSALSVLMVAPTNCMFSAGGGGGGGFGGACGLGGTINALSRGLLAMVVPASPLGGSARFRFGPYGSYIDPQVWTTGVATITINGAPLTTGNATTPGAVLTMAGYDIRTAGGAGTVKLVAPAGLMSTLEGNFPLFVSMTLAVNVYDGEWIPVPEPGTLLLLGSASLGLGLLGRKKQKNRA